MRTSLYMKAFLIRTFYQKCIIPAAEFEGLEVDCRDGSTAHVCCAFPFEWGEVEASCLADP